MGILVCMLMVGCYVSKAESLEDAYFKIVEKKSNKEEVSEDYLKKLLSGYECEKGEESKVGDLEDGGHIQQPYTFTNDDEKLVLTYLNFDNKETISPLYSKKDEKGETSISYIEGTIGDNGEEDGKGFTFIKSSDDIKLHKEISNKLSGSKGKWNKIYMQIADNIAANKNMDIKEIQSLLGEEYTVEEYESSLQIYVDDANKDSKISLIKYKFENDEETLDIEYIKEGNKIWKVFYNNENSSTTIMTTSNSALLSNKEKLHTGIATYLESADIQKELLGIATK